jgi:hypothetical protein
MQASDGPANAALCSSMQKYLSATFVDMHARTMCATSGSTQSTALIRQHSTALQLHSCDITTASARTPASGPTHLTAQTLYSHRTHWMADGLAGCTLCVDTKHTQYKHKAHTQYIQNRQTVHTATTTEPSSASCLEGMVPLLPSNINNCPSLSHTQCPFPHSHQVPCMRLLRAVILGMYRRAFNPHSANSCIS